MGEGEHSIHLFCHLDWNSHFRKHFESLFEVIYTLAIFLGHYIPKYLYKRNKSTGLCLYNKGKRQNMEVNQKFMNSQIDEQFIVYSYNALLLSNKIELNNGTCNNIMNFKIIMLGRRTHNYTVWVHLYKALGNTDQCIVTETMSVLAWAWEWFRGEGVTKRTQVSFRGQWNCMLSWLGWCFHRCIYVKIIKIHISGVCNLLSINKDETKYKNQKWCHHE